LGHSKQCATRIRSFARTQSKQLVGRFAVLGALLAVPQLSCHPAFAQYSTGVLGSAINADALNNIRIGPYQLQASYRFMADHTGTVRSVNFYVITSATKTGYNSGTGGALLVRLETDDGASSHRPSGTVLGSGKIVHPSASFPAITLSPAPKLQSGQLYHPVFANIDSNPSQNHVSVDDLYMYHPLNPMQPLFSNASCAALIRDDTENWFVYDYNTPIFQVNFSDGATMGQGYMEVWPEVPQVIGGPHAVREQFTVSGLTRTVTAFSVRVAHTSGTAPLTVRLETSTGTLIEEGYIPASSIVLSSTSSPDYV
jgi:hypothetical protein